MKTTSLEKVIYFQDYVVVQSRRHGAGETAAADRGRVSRGAEQYGEGSFEADMGAEASANC
jgi:DNA-directed RNA polymerase subunit beta'